MIRSLGNRIFQPRRELGRRRELPLGGRPAVLGARPPEVLEVRPRVLLEEELEARALVPVRQTVADDAAAVLVP